jgi:hypothetical protein
LSLQNLTQGFIPFHACPLAMREAACLFEMFWQGERDKKY